MTRGERVLSVALLIVFLAGGMVTVRLTAEVHRLEGTIGQVKATALTVREGCEAGNELRTEQRQLWDRLVLARREEGAPTTPEQARLFDRWLDDAYPQRKCS